MGFSFPILQRAVQNDAEARGSRVGLLQAANIAGCLAGSLLTGLVALSLVGTTGAVRLILLCGVAFAATGLRRYGLRSPFPYAAAILLLLAWAFPGPRGLWLRFHGAAADAPALLEEDATGVGVIVPNGDRLAVMINGLYHSWLPFGGVHTRLGAFPAVVHPSPRDVAIIGLASGDTPAPPAFARRPPRSRCSRSSGRSPGCWPRPRSSTGQASRPSTASPRSLLTRACAW